MVAGISNEALLFLIADIVLIAIAVLLFVRLRKLKKQCASEKDNQNEPTMIADTEPEEVELEIPGLKPEDLVVAKESRVGLGEETAQMEELKKQDELPAKEEEAWKFTQPEKEDIETTAAAEEVIEVDEVKTVVKPVPKKTPGKTPTEAKEGKKETDEVKTVKKPATKKTIMKTPASPEEGKKETTGDKTVKKPATKKSARKKPATQEKGEKENTVNKPVKKPATKKTKNL